ncbi:MULTISPECIES: glycosyltransferase family 8 protein [Streptococcus]|uniref:Glycosyltransferase family 8 protein n=1 Tax=Streptococcus parasuis TaxID=1501662 RepID=A0A4Q8L0W4_9STRE|nr:MULTISPECIES: glycosyltransferase family 8 protein [Streptococcus]HEM3457668.1 glycosyltransferase family 8 protein [Streptococcus suis]TAA11753.1 glycosyltransferase family 8 protein [Streptococcus parasuis]HEM3213897.1 glycosyltransferase family 8 protein [Streptococcus suis 12814]HEM4253681.1 glycosyltransferase family 8 protein [Streptococcus suis]HEM5243812.1 glycosyltransferase family 8 protein [Streptococcus suis]
MNIVYTLNDVFVPQVATSMCSILENSSMPKQAHFYLLSEGISSVNQKKLLEFVEKYGASISFIELEKLENYFEFSFDTNGWSSIVLARLLIDKLLPEEVERIIYLDGDTLVLGDLFQLWEEELGGKLIGMSPEPTVDSNRRADLDLGSHSYHNAGVMLIDLRGWRDNNIGSKILSYYQNKNGQLFANDQDAINGGVKEYIKTLSIAYNYFNIYDTYPYKTLEKLSSPANFIDKESYNLAKAKPVVIHYLGEERPWRRWNTHKYRNEYHFYLEKTPWNGTPMEEGWFIYFQCFKLFNLVMKPFPMLRYRIINSLIPAFMKFRKMKLQKNR